MHWQLITGPLVGGIIGYITNDIAVRMMFRPYTEKRIFGRRVPFTPGLLPKERPRLAKAIREVLDQELLSPQVLEAALLSDAMVAKLASAADTAIRALLSEQRTLRTVLEERFGKEPVSSVEARLSRTANLFIMEKVLESGIERTAAALVVREIRDRVKGSAMAPLAVLIDEKRGAALEERLADTLREMIATHLPEAVGGILARAAGEGLDTPIGALLSKHEDKLRDVRTFLLDQYAAVIRGALPAALSALDLGAVVEDKLNSLNMAELEGLILSVMRKELRAIVWLGGLLGMVLGMANALLAFL